jgi:hypothetical protein
MGLLLLLLLILLIATGSLMAVLKVALGVALGVFLGVILLTAAIGAYASWRIRRALHGGPPRGRGTGRSRVEVLPPRDDRF